MKIILTSILALMVSFVTFGHNRLATFKDVSLYGDYITTGDLIIDTPTKILNSEREVVYYFMAKQWPGLREGGTIWLDGEKLGLLSHVQFCNSSQTLNPWHIDSVRIKNIPHTKVITENFSCHGLKYFELNGESQFFPGLSEWPESRKFLTGAFGFHVINKMTGGHGYSITVRNGGSIKMTGFEVQHGFSGVRLNGGNYDITVESIEISNFYIHDTGDGEGQYLGATHKPPFAKLKKLKIHDGIIARTAAEAIQVQHLVGGADIHHITIYAADVRWMHEFMAGQDTGIQWSVDAGENSLHHILVDGYGSIGLIPFGSDDNPAPGVSKVSNVLFNDGRDSGIYLHKSTNSGIHWIFDSIYFRGFNALYYQQTGRKPRNYLISKKFGSDRFTFNNIIHDGTKPKVFQDTTGIEVGNIFLKKMPSPEYINTGFYEPANKIKQWHEFYAPYFPVSKKDSVKVKVTTQWDAGDIAIETSGPYFFFKCIKTHSAIQKRPGDNPFFTRLTWDANGTRSDRPQWDSTLLQSDFPPDDLRLKKNNYWEKLGLGYQTIEEKINANTAP
ncbi:MAG: hypothetical protein ABIR06_14175 [Cyclobacteriaceae bacterium]